MTNYHITATIKTKRTPELPIVDNSNKELREEISAYTPKKTVENIKTFRKGCKAGVVDTGDILYKLEDAGKVGMLNKYADIILALPKEFLQEWVSGASWGPNEILEGNISESDQKRMIKYLKSDRCKLSASKADRLRRHMGLSYREIRYVH